MQRFRSASLYSAWLLVLFLLILSGVTWLRKPRNATANADGGPPTAKAEMTEPVSAPASPSAQSRDVKVSIDNFAFKPRELSVAVGTTVTWVNHDDVPHTATSAGASAVLDSKALDTDDKYSFTFTRPGTYNYYCKVHPHMTGSVVVK